MKIVQIVGNRVHWVTPYKTFAEAPPFAPDIVIVEAPEEVREGWLYDAQTGEFSEPLPEQEAVKPVTLEEVAENQLIIMSAVAEIYEGARING